MIASADAVFNSVADADARTDVPCDSDVEEIDRITTENSPAGFQFVISDVVGSLGPVCVKSEAVGFDHPACIISDV